MDNIVGKKRIFELDFLRGLFVILMVLDHFGVIVEIIDYNLPSFANNYYEINNKFLNTFFNFIIKILNSNFRNVMHYLISSLFFLLVGIGCSLSKSNVKRGIKILIAATIISSATVVISIFLGDYYIIFGVLQMIGVSVLVYAIVSRYFYNKWLFLAIGLFIVVWGFLIPWYNVERIDNISDLNFFNIIEVIVGYKVYGADHFGLIPCMGLVFIGAFIGDHWYSNRESLIPKFAGWWSKPLCFVGRHALIIYLVHQVIAFVFLAIVLLIVGYRFF